MNETELMNDLIKYSNANLNKPITNLSLIDRLLSFMYKMDELTKQDYEN